MDGEYRSGRRPSDHVVGDAGPKWLGESVQVWHGSVQRVVPLIPRFDRRPFAIDQSARRAQLRPREQQLAFFPMAAADENRYYDVIIRQCVTPLEAEVPVGIVSKRYALVQHDEVVATALSALASVGIEERELEAELTLTEYASRMAMRLRLPPRFDFTPGDGRRMAVRLECFNSVDRSIPLRVRLGWFRLVCSNGLVVGTTRLHIAQLHDQSLNLGDIFPALTTGLQDLAADKRVFDTWWNTPIDPDQFILWVDGSLCNKWGVHAAARAYHIATTGCDGEPAGGSEKASPHRKLVKSGREVPGAIVPANNAFAVSQILAWLAGQRRDIQEQASRIEDIPGLMGELLEPVEVKSPLVS